MPNGEDIATAVPAYVLDSLRWNYIIGIEVVIVSLLSGKPYMSHPGR